jgi:type VI secretion system secreted protein VgrG
VANAYATTSFDFQNPRERLEAREATGRRPGTTPLLERHEYAGPFAFSSPEDGQRMARLRIQEAELRSQTFEGAGNCRFLTCGHRFELLGHPDRDRRFLVTAVTHEAANNYRESGGKPHYRNRFTCVRAQAPFRPPLRTARPLMPGPQTATVVGPPGEEIFCDRHGRVRVQFPWDREGRFTEASSCWVRVASPWAGDRFGMVAVPRVGQEVLVAFLEGNPDRPIITGSAYNESNPPPWELPAHRTQSGILTRSAQGCDGRNANALRFEDQAGAEEVWLHAEKDQRIEVEHDESHRVDHDRAKTVGHDEATRIQHDRTGTVGHDEVLRIGHDRTETVGADEAVSIAGQQRLSVGKSQHVNVGATKSEQVLLASNERVGGARTLSVGAAYAVTVGGGKNEAVGLGSFEEVGASKQTRVGRSYRIEAGDRLEVTVGQSRLVLDADGTITLAGLALQLTGSNRVKLEGKAVDLN